MAVLEILAAANASISIIKTSLGHGKDIASLGKQVGALLGAEEQLEKAAKKKKNSFKARLLGGAEADFEEFAQLERLRASKRELEQYMMLMCAPGTYNRYTSFMAKARKARREAEKEAARLKEKRQEIALIILLSVIGLILLMGGAYWLYLVVEASR